MLFVGLGLAPLGSQYLRIDAVGGVGMLALLRGQIADIMARDYPGSTG